jgi:hypothetical protein
MPGPERWFEDFQPPDVAEFGDYAIAQAEVNIPRQSRGLYGFGRSKRLVGSLTRPEELEPPKGGRVMSLRQHQV